MKGKERCRILKEIRAKIAEENGIEFAVSECQHKGDCLGTCPKCESEVRYLERELDIKRRLGKSIAVAGVAAGITLSSVGCSYVEEKIHGEALQGDMQIEETVEVDGLLLENEEDVEMDIVGELGVEEEDEILMGEPVAYPMPETPEELEGESSDYVHDVFVNWNISTVLDLWGEPDMTQKSGEEETVAYFTDIHDIVIRYNSETGIITDAEIIVNG